MAISSKESGSIDVTAKTVGKPVRAFYRYFTIIHFCYLLPHKRDTSFFSHTNTHTSSLQCIRFIKSFMSIYLLINLEYPLSSLLVELAMNFTSFAICPIDLDRSQNSLNRLALFLDVDDDDDVKKRTSVCPSDVKSSSRQRRAILREASNVVPASRKPKREIIKLPDTVGVCVFADEKLHDRSIITSRQHFAARTECESRAAGTRRQERTSGAGGREVSETREMPRTVNYVIRATMEISRFAKINRHALSARTYNHALVPRARARFNARFRVNGALPFQS